MTEVKKELMDATVEASANSLFVRALLENYGTILEAKKIRDYELEKILDKIMISETKKYEVLSYVLSHGSSSVSEITKKFDLSDLEVLKYIVNLENEGWLELRDVDTLIYGIKTQINETDNGIEVNLTAPWNTRSIYDPISIIAEANLCCLCGACVSVCPVNAIEIKDDKPIIDEEICIHCGLCNFHCPRTFIPLNLLKNLATGAEVDFCNQLVEQPIGPVRLIKSGQTTDDSIKNVRQDGGMATTFLKYLFDKNEIDGAIVVKRKKDSWDTIPVIVTGFEEVLDASGTKYAVSPNFVAFDKAREAGCKKLAFVGTPCQVQAARKYQAYSNLFEDIWGSIEYVIGIFCMESFAYDNVLKISEEMCNTPITDVTKMDINKGKFYVYKQDGDPVEIPIKEVTSLARNACHYCVDLTNELADISCGSIGSGAGWSTVIVRSEKGEKLYNEALKEGYFEVRDVPADKPFGLPLIEKLANGKRSRNFKHLIKILDESPKFYYNSLSKIIEVDE